VSGGLQKNTDFGETVTSVCSETGLTVSADGSEVSGVRAEEVLHTQEEDHLAVVLPAVKVADTVCYVCNIVVLTVVQACAVASACWHYMLATLLPEKKLWFPFSWRLGRHCSWSGVFGEEIVLLLLPKFEPLIFQCIP
jgi:hypothetical protein